MLMPNRKSRMMLYQITFFSFVFLIGNFCLSSSSPATAEVRDSKLVSITFKNTDMREVLNILAFKGGVNIVAGEDVDVKVTVQLKNVPWEQALDVILKTYNFTYRKEANLIRVMSLQRALEEEGKIQLETKIIPLNFANVEELKASLSDILSKRGNLSVDKRTNSLIVTDIPSIVVKVEVAAMSLDTRTPQVLIEAMMIDVKVTDENKWGSVLSLIKDSSQEYPNRFDTSLSAGGSGGVFEFFGGILKDIDFHATIDTWVHQNKAQILANPSVLTLDNQEAKIEIIEEIPYFESVDTGGGVTINVKFKEAGIKLYVTPHITSGNYISMNVRPEQSFKSDEVLNNPVIDTRRAETNLLVKDGQTIVIGGLRKTNDNITYDKIPFFGDIPFLGLLFKKKLITKIETELVLFVTPHIIVEPIMTEKEREWLGKLDQKRPLSIDQRTEVEKFKDMIHWKEDKEKAKKIASREAFRQKRLKGTSEALETEEEDDEQHFEIQRRVRPRSESAGPEILPEEYKTEIEALDDESSLIEKALNRMRNDVAKMEVTE